MGALSEGAILVILPKKMSRKEKALIREKVRRHKDVAEYGQFLIVDNDAFGFNLGMKVTKRLGGVDRVHPFILGRVVFDDELSDRLNQELSVYHGKIPKHLHKTRKEEMRKRPGLPKSSRIPKTP